MSYSTATPYLSAFVILRKGNMAAFVMRENTAWMNGHYSLPAGKVEIGERLMTATVREALEEAGVKVKESDLRHVHTCHRKADDDTDSWLDVLFETDIWEGDGFNAEPTSHSEFKWLDLFKLPDNIVPSQRHELEQVRLGKTYSEFNWEEK